MIKKQRSAECFGCQMVSKHPPPPPIKPTRLPERAWQEIAVDLLGPLPTGEHLLVVVDYFSRWMEVDVLRSTTSAAVIKCLDNHFARYGMPAGLRTDNGSNLKMERMFGGNGDCASLQHTFVAQSQWRGGAPEPLTSQSHESLPSRRERLAAGAQQVSSGLPINQSHHNRC